MDLKSVFRMSVLFFICIWALADCVELSDYLHLKATTEELVDSAKGVLKICEWGSNKSKANDPVADRCYYVKKDPKTGNYYEAYKDEDGKWYWTDKGEDDRKKI